MVLLDSNAVIYIAKGELDIDTLFDEDELYCISIITYMEVLGYLFETKEEESVMTKLLSLFEIVYIDEAIAAKVIEIRRKYKIKLPDAIICATSMCTNTILCTNDIRLKVIDDLDLKLIGNH